MSLFTREAKAIRIEKVENGFCLKVFKNYEGDHYSWNDGSFKKDQVFYTVEELTAAIQKTWKPEAVVTQ